MHRDKLEILVTAGISLGLSGCGDEDGTRNGGAWGGIASAGAQTSGSGSADTGSGSGTDTGATPEDTDGHDGPQIKFDMGPSPTSIRPSKRRAARRSTFSS